MVARLRSGRRALASPEPSPFARELLRPPRPRLWSVASADGAEDRGLESLALLDAFSRACRRTGPPAPPRELDALLRRLVREPGGDHARPPHGPPPPAAYRGAWWAGDGADALLVHAGPYLRPRTHPDAEAARETALMLAERHLRATAGAPPVPPAPPSVWATRDSARAAHFRATAVRLSVAPGREDALLPVRRWRHGAGRRLVAADALHVCQAAPDAPESAVALVGDEIVVGSGGAAERIPLAAVQRVTLQTERTPSGRVGRCLVSLKGRPPLVLSEEDAAGGWAWAAGERRARDDHRAAYASFVGALQGGLSERGGAARFHVEAVGGTRLRLSELPAGIWVAPVVGIAMAQAWPLWVAAVGSASILASSLPGMLGRRTRRYRPEELPPHLLPGP